VTLFQPDDPWAWHAKARFFLKAKLYDQAMKLKPDNPDYLTIKGTILLLSGKYSDALKVLDQAISINAEDPQSHYRRAQTHAALHQREAMLADLKKALVISQPTIRGLSHPCSGRLIYRYQKFLPAALLSHKPRNSS
jgi:tetratricopeptide (TPR) repeat protein